MCSVNPLAIISHLRYLFCCLISPSIALHSFNFRLINEQSPRSISPSLIAYSDLLSLLFPLITSSRSRAGSCKGHDKLLHVRSSNYFIIYTIDKLGYSANRFDHTKVKYRISKTIPSFRRLSSIPSILSLRISQWSGLFRELSLSNSACFRLIELLERTTKFEKLIGHSRTTNRARNLIMFVDSTQSTDTAQSYLPVDRSEVTVGSELSFVFIENPALWSRSPRKPKAAKIISKISNKTDSFDERCEISMYSSHPDDIRQVVS